MAQETMTTSRSHAMPFGTEVRPDGVVFRLWAPGASAVELALEQVNGGPAFFPMVDDGDGWHRLFSPLTGPGSRYRFRIDHHLLVPDPASRCQAEDVHGPSVVIDPLAFSWRDTSWRGRPWEEAVIYELHTGAFTPDGCFSGVIERLDYLVDLGITAIELMPVADFPGQRNWGYDGALLFAPDRAYGSPDDLKELVQAAHDRNLMVLLDVVYNHFGPEGNYLYVYAKEAFFDERRKTPWGGALNFDGEGCATVRRFFLDNALYWLEEYHLDGLRIDAVHAIFDESSPHILEKIAQVVRAGPGRHRHIHLILENDDNRARYLRRAPTGVCPLYNAQWNDDLHHCCHVLLTHEHQGYYVDYATHPLELLGRCLTEGFAYQGEASPYRDHRPRGERSDHLPPTAFVSFLQNHDQIGNRAFGERLGHLASEPLLRMTVALVLLAPSVPLLFMGEEFGSTTPFLYFCDFGPDLAAKVKEGRRREFSRFPVFAAPGARALIPDPNQPATFERSCLDWRQADQENGRRWLELYRELLALRQQTIVPRLAGPGRHRAWYSRIGDGGLHVRWSLAGGGLLEVLANFSGTDIDGVAVDANALLSAPPRISGISEQRISLKAHSIIWLFNETEASCDAEQ
jgi:malto-oligosyltrehalose trehalohydrolase